MIFVAESPLLAYLRIARVHFILVSINYFLVCIFALVIYYISHCNSSIVTCQGFKLSSSWIGMSF